MPAFLALAAMALAFAQRPGKTVFDSRVELSADASLFLHRVAGVWSPTGDLGHVQSGQFVGYLFPMAPWFALVQWLGLPMWVGQRLWLGAVIGACDLGRCPAGGRALRPQARSGAPRSRRPVRGQPLRGGVDHARIGLPARVRGGAMADGRCTPRGTRPARLAVAGRLRSVSREPARRASTQRSCSGCCRRRSPSLLYEAVVLRVGGARVAGFAWRALVCCLLGSAWWAIPLLLQARYGTDFLSFTELPTSVWATTSLPESLRLLGYWLLYLGVGGVPVVGDLVALPVQPPGDRRDLPACRSSRSEP